MNRQDLTAKLGTITAALLQEKGYIAFIDIFIRLGYLDPKEVDNWRRRRLPYLERVITTNLSRISFIMRTVRRSALNGHLKPSFTVYHSWGKGPKVPLRFSKHGVPAIETLYATHFVCHRARSTEAATSDP
jgi:hypothetical protein